MVKHEKNIIKEKRCIQWKQITSTHLDVFEPQNWNDSTEFLCETCNKKAISIEPNTNLNDEPKENDYTQNVGVKDGGNDEAFYHGTTKTAIDNIDKFSIHELEPHPEQYI